MSAAPILAYGRITTSDGIEIFGPTFSQRDGWHWRIEDARGPTTITPWAEGDEMGGVLDRYRKGLEGWSGRQHADAAHQDQSVQDDQGRVGL